MPDHSNGNQEQNGIFHLLFLTLLFRIILLLVLVLDLLLRSLFFRLRFPTLILDLLLGLAESPGGQAA